MKPATVIVSGAPGSGKTTLARPLAAALGFALLSKDDIKESLFETIPGNGNGDELAWSRGLGGAAMELLWTLAPHCPQVVLEAPFRHRHEREREMLGRLTSPLIEPVCVQRYASRARHQAHVIKQVSLELLAEFDRPVGLGHVITVDTTQPADIALLAARVRHLL
jgi:predicted kinase